MNKLMPHIADIEIKALSPTLEGLFRDNLEAMNDILKEMACDKVSHFDCLMRLEVTATDITDLLVHFLSDILSLTYVQKTIFCNVYFSELTDQKVIVQLFGTWIGAFDKEIKAVNCHEAYARKTDDNIWESHIIFDI